MEEQWREEAKCRTSGADYFLDSVKTRMRDTAAAYACQGCPVWRECARSAIEEGAQGVVRAGVYLPVSITLARRKLEDVLKDGMPDKPKKPGLVTKPRGTCQTCGRGMRSPHANSEDWPGTMVAQNKTTCRQCYAINAGTRPCKECGREMRSTHATVTQFPGSTTYGKDGMCQLCARRAGRKPPR